MWFASKPWETTALSEWEFWLWPSRGTDQQELVENSLANSSGFLFEVLTKLSSVIMEGKELL